MITTDRICKKKKQSINWLGVKIASWLNSLIVSGKHFCIPIIQLHVYIYKYMRKHNQLVMKTSITNEYTSLQKYKSLTLYFRKGDVLLCVRDEWRQGQTAVLTQVLLLTIAALLSHLGSGCSTVGPWRPGPLQAGSHFGIPVPTDRRPWAPCLSSFLSPTCSRSSSAYLWHFHLNVKELAGEIN